MVFGDAKLDGAIGGNGLAERDMCLVCSLEFEADDMHIHFTVGGSICG